MHFPNDWLADGKLTFQSSIIYCTLCAASEPVSALLVGWFYP